VGFAVHDRRTRAQEAGRWGGDCHRQGGEKDRCQQHHFEPGRSQLVHLIEQRR